MKAVKVVLVDDEILFREGIKLLLERSEIEVVGSFDNGREFLDWYQDNKKQFDVILLDLSMPVLDGIDTVKELKNNGALPKVVILTSHYNDNIIIKMLDEGVAGFLPKTANPTEVVKTVNSVHQNGFYINDYVLNLIRNKRILSKDKLVGAELSMREIEVLTLICEEKTNKEIAKDLFLSRRTVEGHRNRIMEKINAKNTVGMIIYAIEHGIYAVNISKYN